MGSSRFETGKVAETGRNIYNNHAWNKMYYYITERSVRWYNGISIAAARKPWRRYNTQKIFNRSLKKCICGQIPPWGTLLLEFDTLRRLEQLRSQPNNTHIHQILKMQYLHITNGLIVFKFYTEVKYLNPGEM